jgi:hypothetical protein
MTVTSAPPEQAHPDLLGGPLDQSITFRTNRLMANALRKRALVEGRDVAFLIRDLIRRGGASLERPIDFTARNI